MMCDVIVIDPRNSRLQHPDVSDIEESNHPRVFMQVGVKREPGLFACEANIFFLCQRWGVGPSSIYSNCRILEG